MEYLNFDLSIERLGSSEFRARVMNDPLGESASTTFRLPFDDTQLENLLLKLDPGRAATRRVAMDPRASAALQLGGALFDAVFSGDVLLAWSRSKDISRERGRGLRLRLMLSGAPTIAGLPWELLYDRRRASFVALSEKTPLVRYLEVPDPPRPLSVKGSLKILVVVSSPTDLPPLDVDGEWSRFRDALGPKIAEGKVELDRLPSPTIAALSAWLRVHQVNVLHFIGHGGYDANIEDGVLYFCDRYSRQVEIPPSVLGPFLRDHDPLRLVVLNACHSARVDSTDPFSGMAQGLVQQDCTAVVAMQFPISDPAATDFTGEFYGALADGLPVDQAVTTSRKALLASHIEEWATPVLFLRSPDGMVFDSIEASPVPTLAPRSSESAIQDDPLSALRIAAPVTGPAGGAVVQDPGPPTGPDPASPAVLAVEVGRHPRTGKIAVVGLLVAALLVASVIVLRSRSSTEDPQVVHAPTVASAPGTAASSQASATAAEAPPARTLNVPATQAWTDTGLSCEPGLSLGVTASGTVRHDASKSGTAVGPDGAVDPGLRQFNVDGLPDANHSGLIGRLGDSPPFVVGSSFTYSCEGEGPFQLGVNDKGVDNNSGAFIATITPHR